MNNLEIIRTDSTQIDYDKVYDSKTEFEIIWLSDCEYQLKRINGKINSGLKDFELSELVFKIDSVNENYFRYLLLLKDTNTLIDTTELIKIE